VNAQVLLMLAALAADPAETSLTTFRSITPQLEAAIRGQTPTYEDDAALGASSAPAQTYVAPPGNYMYDPFMGQPPAGGYGYPVMIDQGYSFGPLGSQPYRFGWTTRFDTGFIDNAPTSNGFGDFGVFEVNAAMRHSAGWPQSMPSWIFSVTPEFNYRSWQGPNLIDLPENVFRFAGDFELATPGNGPWSMQLGFTPAFVSDLNGSPTSDAINWDGRGVLFFRASPQLMLVGGAAYWDRVHDQIIPYAGIVWTPNDYWEFRLLYPKSRISLFLGNALGVPTWVYGGVEYTAEAYQIELLASNGRQEKIELRDYRAMFGVRTEGGGVSSFAEVGWVFSREANFLYDTPQFDISPAFTARLGIRY
jgi:hypothetical protein